MLWEQYAVDSLLEYPSKSQVEVQWESESAGRIITFGYLDNRPLCIHINWAGINGKDVLFVDHTSQLCDWAALDDWLKEFCPKASVNNAMNFPLGEICS